MFPTTYGYDTSRGLLTYIQDANNDKVCYTYDARGRVIGIQAKKADNTVTGEVGYTYGGNGLSQITGEGAVYTFVYDEFGNMECVQLATATLATYTYESNNGNLVSIEYGNGYTISYTYDALDRIESVRENDVLQYSCTYDGYGNICCIYDVSAGCRRYYEYDSIGRLIRTRELTQGGMFSNERTH